MGQYAPDDSRDVTLSSNSAPGEPERTGFREGETREGQARRGEQSRAQKKQDSSRTDSDPPQRAEDRSGEGPVEQNLEADAKRSLGGA